MSGRKAGDSWRGIKEGGTARRSSQSRHGDWPGRKTGRHHRADRRVVRNDERCGGAIETNGRGICKVHPRNLYCCARTRVGGVKLVMPAGK